MVNSMDEKGDICKDSIEAREIRNIIQNFGSIIWIT